MNSANKGDGGGLLEVPCGRGKCLGKNTPVLMYDCTIKNVQDICVGDLIMGDDSKKTRLRNWWIFGSLPDGALRRPTSSARA